MSLATAELPADPAALRAFALACQSELKAAETAVQLKALEIEKLRFQIAKLRRMQFGRSSERISRQIEQLEFQLEELETGAAEAAARTEALDPPAPAPAPANTGRSVSRSPSISHARRSCICLLTMAPASAATVVAAWPGWGRTSPRCWITCTNRHSIYRTVSDAMGDERRVRSSGGKRGRPQALRLRRPASRLRGLTSATYRQVGIDAVVANPGCLPRSEPRSFPTLSDESSPDFLS